MDGRRPTNKVLETILDGHLGEIIRQKSKMNELKGDARVVDSLDDLLYYLLSPLAILLGLRRNDYAPDGFPDLTTLQEIEHDMVNKVPAPIRTPVLRIIDGFKEYWGLNERLGLQRARMRVLEDFIHKDCMLLLNGQPHKAMLQYPEKLEKIREELRRHMGQQQDQQEKNGAGNNGELEQQAIDQQQEQQEENGAGSGGELEQQAVDQQQEHQKNVAGSNGEKQQTTPTKAPKRRRRG